MIACAQGNASWCSGTCCAWYRLSGGCETLEAGRRLLSGKGRPPFGPSEPADLSPPPPLLLWADVSFANCGLPYHVGGVIPVGAGMRCASLCFALYPPMQPPSACGRVPLSCLLSVFINLCHTSVSRAARLQEESSLLVASAAKFNNWFNVKVKENTEVRAASVCGTLPCAQFHLRLCLGLPLLEWSSPSPARRASFTTQVVAIDRAARTITARGPGGEERHE